MKQCIISLLAVTMLSAVTSLPAWADGRGEENKAKRLEKRHEIRVEKQRTVRSWKGERDIHHFENRHLPVWRSGAWHHGRYGGRVGWWWIVAGTWYFYPEPIYPYPDPYIPPYVAVQPAPATTTPAVPAPPQSWYYCEASKNYYPYVSTCPAGWKAVPATPASPPTQ